jgi:glycerophosphoryl diester phosphodiesterase
MGKQLSLYATILIACIVQHTETKPAVIAHRGASAYLPEVRQFVCCEHAMFSITIM